jgi:hypothetical protein
MESYLHHPHIKALLLHALIFSILLAALSDTRLETFIDLGKLQHILVALLHQLLELPTLVDWLDARLQAAVGALYGSGYVLRRILSLVGAGLITLGFGHLELVAVWHRDGEVLRTQALFAVARVIIGRIWLFQ